MMLLQDKAAGRRGKIKERINIKRIAYIGVLTSAALILGLVESLVPMPFSGVPGIKLGLSNIAVLISVYLLGRYEGFVVLISKVLLSFVLYAGISGLIYSVCGAILSYLVIFFLSKKQCFTPIGVSAASAAAHNTGQILAAFFITQSKGLFLYLPVLIIFGTVFGAFTGFLTKIILIRLKAYIKRSV